MISKKSGCQLRRSERFTMLADFATIWQMALAEKIVSGGQTGADRAALDWSIKNGIPHGGWCPKGRKAEDGPIDGKYQLKETPSSNYPQRTEWNVRDSDGTVVFSVKAVLTGGSKRTVDLARQHHSRFFICGAKAGCRHPSGRSGVSSATTTSRCSTWRGRQPQKNRRLQRL